MATTKQVSMKPERLHILAQNIAERIPDFFVTKGPGAGDHAANRFMELLNEAAKGVFGDDYSNKMACKGAKFCIDFYFSGRSYGGRDRPEPRQTDLRV